MVVNLNGENFEQETKDMCIVDFYADWCGPCKRLAPIFEELAAEYEGKLKFCKLNTEDSPDLATKFNVMGIPCLIILSKGEEVDRIVGLASKEDLKQKIDAALDKA